MKTKKKQEKNNNISNFSVEKILKGDNSFVLSFIDEIKNGSEKKNIVKEFIEYLENCLLDRDAGKPGPKLIDQLRERMNNITNVQEGYKAKGVEEKVWWKGSEPQIIYFFELLFNTNLIDKSQYDSRYALIEANFKNKLGKPFDNTQLAKATQNMNNSKSKGKPRKKDADEIENVLREIREILKE